MNSLAHYPRNEILVSSNIINTDFSEMILKKKRIVFDSNITTVWPNVNNLSHNKKLSYNKFINFIYQRNQMK